MADTFYFFYEPSAKAPWVLALASERDRINREIKPELNTALDVNYSFDKELDFEAKSQLRYRGDAFFDFDLETIDEAIASIQEFLTNLKTKSVNLRSLRIYCSGGKGFHIEMPACMMLAKVPVNGIQGLPLIYKEMAHELFVNGLDLRVYSQGKGRQWRQPNIRRSDKPEKELYKVQITAEEAFSMTTARYDELVSRPRPTFPTEPALFTPDLALIYAKAQDKVSDSIKNRKKRKPNTDLKRFDGKWPKTLQTILSGQGLKENVGWNYIAFQLTLAATALGIHEDQMVVDAQGLIETYQGDSSRYGSPAKRKTELLRMYHYVNENPCHEYSAGGVLSMVTKETLAATDLNLGEFVADTPTAPAEGVEPEPEFVEEEDDSQQVRINRNGIWSRGETGWKCISDVGIANETLLKLPAGDLIGYDVDVFLKGKKQDPLSISINDINGKAALHNLLVRKMNSAYMGSDMDTARLVNYLRDRVKSRASVSFVTQVEGIDLIVPPNARTKEDVDILWSSPNEVITLSERNKYVFRPGISGSAGFRSDLWNAEPLTKADRQMIDDLLNINAPQNLARMLGWYGATFLCPVLRHYYAQFPLLQIYGGASAGKSKTISLLSHLHFHLGKPKITSASQYTPFALLAAVASTSSLPVYLEELRARFLGQVKWANAIGILKSSYDGLSIERGGLGDKGQGAVVNSYACTAPIVYIAEEKNGEVAVQERSVSVCLSEMDRYGRDEPYDRLLEKAQDLGRLGKSMAESVLALNVRQFRDEFNEVIRDIKTEMGKARDGKDRPIFNLATTVIGLRLMQRSIQSVFGSEFDGKFDMMNACIRENVADFVPTNMSEASRVLDTLAQLTKILDVQFKLEYGREYTVSDDGLSVDLKLKPAYAKYMRYSRSLGTPPLYDSDQAFVAAMARYGGVTSKACVDNERLFGGPSEPCYRLSTVFMEKESIEGFRA